MKGIILAGGFGNRLKPLTDITNKHLLPVYDRPMILYPLQTLVQAGIRDILIVIGPEYAGGFFTLLGDGESYGCSIVYRCQERAGGIAQALSLAADFVGTDNCAVILGDNIYEDDLTSVIKNFADGAMIFLKATPEAGRFGVAELDSAGKKVIGIQEKPERPKSDYAVTGLYLYDQTVFSRIAQLKPSARGEYEITDVNNSYVASGQMESLILKGEWTDAGTFESLFHANQMARRKALLIAQEKHDL